MHRILLALFLLVGTAQAIGSVDDTLRNVARSVQVGREIAHALLAACSPHYRALGFDPRFFTYFWDASRVEVFEGARIALGEEDTSLQKDSIELPLTPPSTERCEAVAREDALKQTYQVVPGVATEDIQRLRSVYLATGPDPRVARDKSLTTDCMRANFNARRLDFDGALQRCDCTLSVMHTLPSADLDEWLRLTRSGAGAPMAQQPWFPALLPKLQACWAR